MLMSRRLLLLLHVLCLVDYILLLMLQLVRLLLLLIVVLLAVLVVMLRVDQAVPGCGGNGTLQMLLLHWTSVCGREAVMGLGLGAVLHLRRLLLHLSG